MGKTVEFFFDFGSPYSYLAYKALPGIAAAHGVFGARTFFVGDAMFWGQDRLDFVAEALGK